MMNKILQGDCLIKLKELEDNSIDSIVTDPPYELGFMGKSWDNTGIANNKEMWAECLRVLKPGGYLLSFGGTRTYHRMASAIEDAGFEVRDMIEWVYGSGFPKSLNIGKAVDKLQGNEREVLGTRKVPDQRSGGINSERTAQMGVPTRMTTDTKGTSEWEGWGTALKPSHEPIIVSMKPLQVEQIFAILIDNIWNNLPVSDVMQNLRDTQAKLNEVVSSVPVNVRTNFLENLETAEFVGQLTTSLAIKSKKAKESSAQESVARSGEKLSQEIKTHTGEVEDVSLVDISTSVQMGDISESIVLLWKNLSEELLNQTNTLTTRMAIRKIIELKTLRSCLIQNTGINTGHSKKIPPSHEPICMARKPLAEKTVAENVLKYGTGGINIDESRVETTEELNYGTGKKSNVGFKTSPQNNDRPIYDGQGRFPANLIHDNSEEVRECFPESKSGAMNGTYKNTMMKGEPGIRDGKEIYLQQEASSGSASRFFKSIIYQAKSSKSDRTSNGTVINTHPTVKSVTLMTYLIKMVTPKGGVVLDPFAGSGSTLVAAKQNGYQYIGIEMTEEYIPIIKARLN